MGKAGQNGAGGPLDADADPDPEIDEGSLRAMIAAALGAVLDREDELEVHTHAGSKFHGVVEDSNLSLVALRCDDGKLRLVPFTSIDHAVIGEDVDEEDTDEDAATADAGGDAAGDEDPAPDSPRSA